MSTSASAVSGIGEAAKPVRIRDPFNRLRSVGVADDPRPTPVDLVAMPPMVAVTRPPTTQKSANGMGQAGLYLQIFDPPSICVPALFLILILIFIFIFQNYFKF
jgi:hypothetical protein